jgi:SAM domain (Sterile alpha motif)
MCAGECAAVQEIAEWLDKLGMSEYEQRFAENGINVAALPHLIIQRATKLLAVR